MKIVWVVLGSVAVACGLGGCGKTHANDHDSGSPDAETQDPDTQDPGSSPGAPPLEKGEFLVAFTKGWCEGRVGCCQAQGLSVDADWCRTEITAAIASHFDVEPGITEFDSQAAGDCVAALGTWIRCGLEVDEAAPEACDRIIVGKLVAGESCTRGEECAPSKKPNFRAYCSSDSAGAAGVCAEMQSDEDAPRTGDVGDACRGSSACRPPLFCNGKAGKCETRHQDGTPCDVDLECASGACEQGICGDPQLDAAQCNSALQSPD